MATPNATSSPASADGPTPFVSPDGQTMIPFGQGVAHVSRSVRAGSGEALTIRVISGPHGAGSSASVALTWSLANRLRAKTDSRGSTLFRLTWKERATPSGRVIYALRASGHPTSGNACSSWPSPMAGSKATDTYNEAGNTDSSRKTVALIGWPTPRTPTGGAESGERKKELGRLESGGGDLQAAAKLAPWPTPNTMEGGQTSRGGKRKGELLMGGLVRSTASGPPPTGSPAPTANPGQLNPAHSRWLMGFPPAWDDCAVTAMPSFRKRPKRSSKPIEP